MVSFELGFIKKHCFHYHFIVLYWLQSSLLWVYSLYSREEFWLSPYCLLFLILQYSQRPPFSCCLALVLGSARRERKDLLCEQGSFLVLSLLSNYTVSYFESLERVSSEPMRIGTVCTKMPLSVALLPFVCYVSCTSACNIKKMKGHFF